MTSAGATAWTCEHPDAFYSLAGFVGDAEHPEIVGFLRSVPMVPEERHDPRTAFAFVAPVYDGRPITSRREAAAGTPVAFDGGTADGVPMPEPIARLRDRVVEAVVALRAAHPSLPVHPDDPGRTLGSCAPRFTSVYVDHYRAGGSFVPHTDREIYGPVVAGVSVGDGRATLEFTRPGAPPFTTTVRPRSLYVFFGALRWPPWKHAVRDVAGTRYSITFRDPARG